MTTTAVQQDLRALMQRFIDDVINAQDLDGALVEIVAEDFVELNPLPGQGPGRAGLGDVLAMMFTGFPDLQWTIHDTLVEGDRVMGFSTWTGTHNGEFMGIPATGTHRHRSGLDHRPLPRRHLRREPHPHGRRRTTRPTRRSPNPASRLSHAHPAPLSPTR